MTARPTVRLMRTIAGRELEEVEFRRSWKAFDTFPTDFLATTAALRLDHVGVYSRVRAAVWLYGDGWSHRATMEAWRVHTGTGSIREVREALKQLAARELLFVEESADELTIADPAMHADLLRKEQGRNRKGGKSRGKSKATSRVKSNATSEGEGEGRGQEESEADAVLAHYRSRSKLGGVDPSRSVSTPARKRLVADRLAEGRTVEELCRAIDGYWRSPFHRGEKPDQPTPRLSLELILRDAKHVEDGLAYAAPPPAAAEAEELPDLRQFVTPRRAPTNGEPS